jgi:DNA-binding NarL/FixJ family response regulator
VRIAIAEDWTLTRETMAGMLPAPHFEVIIQAATGAQLLNAVIADQPDVAIIDIRMDGACDGLDAAECVRARYPQMGVLLLSQYCETTYAIRAAELGDKGVGYLTKDNVNLATLKEALHRINAGETYLDQAIIQRLVHRQRAIKTLVSLTAREHQVLHLMAQGRSNKGIGQHLCLSPRTIEGAITAIYEKLGLEQDKDLSTDNRRTRAILKLMEAACHPTTDAA